MASRMALLAFLVLAAVAAVSAHSWLDCADWRFNNPAAMTDESLRRWADADGKCYGHARRFEVTQKIFGKMDEVQFFRHYVQPFTSGALACRNNGGRSSDSGSSEGVLAPRSLAYAPNKNPYGLLYGTMAQVVPGQTLCWRWPAKNHFAHVNVKTNPLFINWDDVPNRPPPSLTQAEMDTKRVAQVLWANCPVPGPASNGDSTGTGSELRPCGGCFTVPQRSPGIYTVQWEWPFKNANSETYTSCADIEVLGSANSAVNCAVSAWSGWGTCSSNCGSGSQVRTRTITTQPTVGTNAGTACPTLTESQPCNTQSCSATGGSSIGVGISEHVVYEDSLVDFTDWSWARNNYNLAATNIVHGGSRSISWTPKAWEAIYFNHNLGVATVAEFQSISFWINGGSSSGQQITFSLVTTSRTSSPLFTYPIPRASIRANTWTKVEIVFSKLRLISQKFDGIWWQDASGRSQSTVYIDDINFMHVHSGGPAAAITEDPCDTVTCTGNSACLGGQCFCTNGYYGDGCTTPGSITGVSFQSLAELDTTTIEGGSMYTVSWTANGTLPIVSVLLYKSGSNIPEHLTTQTVNTGSYTWEVPSTLPSGTYTIRVAYTRSVYGESPALTKTAAAVDNGCDDCNGHGVCDDDTAPACVCRYGYTGDDCESAPSGVTKTRASIVAGAPMSLYQEDKEKLEEVFRADLAAGLLVEPDQIDIESVTEHTSGTTLVTFDVLNGGSFAASTLGLESNSGYNAALAAQLARADSAINRGTYTYAVAPSANAATMSRSSSFLVATALALAAVAAVAL